MPTSQSTKARPRPVDRRTYPSARVRDAWIAEAVFGRRVEVQWLGDGRLVLRSFDRPGEGCASFLWLTPSDWPKLELFFDRFLPNYSTDDGLARRELLPWLAKRRFRLTIVEHPPHRVELHVLGRHPGRWSGSTLSDAVSRFFVDLLRAGYFPYEIKLRTHEDREGRLRRYWWLCAR
jgi:hypothetical protein